MADLLEPEILDDAPLPIPPDENNDRPSPIDAKIEEFKKQQVENVEAKIDAGKQKLSPKTTADTPNGATTAAQKVAEPARERGRQALANTIRQGTKKAGQAVSQTAKRVVAKVAEAFVADNPIVWIIAIILVIFILIAVAIGLFAFSRQSGVALPNRPSTAVQKSQAGLLAAFAGDKLKQFTIVEGVIQSEEARYVTIAGLMKTNPGGGNISASATDVAQVQTELQQIDKQLKAQDKVGATVALKNVIDQEKKIEAGLPFGAWISSIAQGFADPSSPYHKDTQVCHLANVDYAATANGRRGCALVVSVILNEAGVPQSLVLATQQVWDNPAYSIVVPRPAALDHNLAKNSLANLKPGDIVWWGNGSSNNGTTLFNHVGIYIGGGQTVNNSSSSTEVRKTPLDRTDTIFNGAKRYAP